MNFVYPYSLYLLILLESKNERSNLHTEVFMSGGDVWVPIICPSFSEHSMFGASCKRK